MKKIETQNYWKGRSGFEPESIVLHITEGSLGSVINHFGNPASYVSSHYVVAGEVYSCVKEEYAAWHAGRVLNPTWPGLKFKDGGVGASTDGLEELDKISENRGEQGKIFQGVGLERSGGDREAINPNLYTIGVEVVSFGEFPGWDKWVRVAKLVKDISERHDISLDKVGLVNHKEIRSDKWCPGQWISRRWISLLAKYV